MKDVYIEKKKRKEKKPLKDDLRSIINLINPRLIQ